MELWDELSQLIISGLKSDSLLVEEKREIERGGIGGVIFFNRNIEEQIQLSEFIREIKGWYPSSLPPLILAIDHEGGRVQRIKEPFLEIPPAKALGERATKELIYKIGLIAGKELSSIGLNLNFSPVLDVLTNPKNKVIGDRSFGDNPGVVSKLGITLAKGLIEGGVYPCGKHFPGHGSTTTDSHFEVTFAQSSFEEWKQRELLPFKNYIYSGFQLLMTAHVIYPFLDEVEPATTSEVILTDILRKKLRYDGVIVSDSMSMKGVLHKRDIREACKVAIKAGVDMLLISDAEGIDVVNVVKEYIVREAEKDNILRGRIEESYQRVVNLKKLFLNLNLVPLEYINSELHRREKEEILKGLMRRGEGC